MAGLTPSDVERFFHQSRARRRKPVDPAQERLNQAVIKRARERLAELERRERYFAWWYALERAADLLEHDRAFD